MRFYESNFISIISKRAPSCFAYFVSAWAYSMRAKRVTFGGDIFLAATPSSCDMFNLISGHFLAEVRGRAEALNDFFYRHAYVQEERRKRETFDV